MELQQIQGFLKTPALWETTLLEVEQFIIPEISIENFEPKPIPQNIRLGHQIEYVFHQLIEHSKAYDILLFNQPIRNDIRTIGEIDFILKDIINQDIIHVELTYKFYLVDTSKTVVFHQLIGPNKKDSFYEKIQKIKNKQFKLLNSQEAIKVLTGNSIPINNIVSKTCFKGQLFTPYKLKSTNISPFNEACVFGYWISHKEFNTPEFKNSEYYLPLKPEWIITPHQHVKWQSFLEIEICITKLHTNHNSPMVWKKISNFTFEKFFVVWW